MKTVNVQYFALLREQAGLAGESLRTGAETPAELFEELRQRHKFGLGRASLKVAVNDDFAAWDRPLSDGDMVIFIPPVAGG